MISLHSQRRWRGGVFAFVVLAAALSCGPSDRRTKVIYYYQNGTDAAARLRPALKALETEFPGQVAVLDIEASTPEAQKDIQRLGFASHGLVVRDQHGILLYRQSGDDFSLEEIRATLRQAAGAG